MSTDSYNLLVERCTLTDAAQLAMAVRDDPDADDSIRDLADDVFKETSTWLLFGENIGLREVRLVPIMFRWPGSYREMVAEFLTDVGSRACERNPLLVQLAQHAVELVESECYAVDFRLDCLDALNQVLAQLKARADEMESEAESDDSPVRQP